MSELDRDHRVGHLEESSPGSSLCSAHVLVVDDDEMTRGLTGCVLRRAGYRVTLASNGEEALIQLYLSQLSASAVDLILTDVVMPTMAGGEFVAEVRKRGCSLPIVVMTGASDRSVIQKMWEVGVDQVLFKPVTARQLNRAIENSLLYREGHGGDGTRTGTEG